MRQWEVQPMTSLFCLREVWIAFGIVDELMVRKVMQTEVMR